METENTNQNAPDALAGGTAPSGTEDVPVETAEGRLAAMTAERDKLAAEKADLQDRLLRARAEFDNARRRAERERSEYLQFAAMDMVKEKLIDELQRKFAAKFVGIGFNFSQYIQDNVEEGLSGVKGANSVKIIGRDLATLEALSRQVLKEMASVEGVTDLGVFPVLGQPNLNIKVKRDEAEMLVIAQKLGFKDLASFRASFAGNAKLHAHSTDELIGLYSHYLDQMRPKLPQLFGTLPKAPLVVKPVPEYMQQDQTQAYYVQGSPDGKRPGVVYVNFYKFDQRLLTNVESIAYHEGLPGHHLQISIAQELTGLPEFRKYTSYTAYTEGWGLYSERFGKDAGFYQDPYSDYGRLEADEWRAIRLVIDTGVHSMHWSRQQMLDYFREHSSMDDTNIQAEVDRYIAWPAQALGYKMGQLKILELRDRAKTALGPKFDIKAFHDEVLDSGALPMDVLEQRVDEWIASQKK